MSHMLSLTLVTKPGGHEWATAYNLLSTVALDNGINFAAVSVHSQDLEDELELTGDLEEIEEFHDENTMMKVYDAIKRVVIVDRREFYLNDDQTTQIVNALQNAGIVFREIKR
jgi:hypothetical protein